jgi:hypothetical protein
VPCPRETAVEKGVSEPSPHGNRRNDKGEVKKGGAVVSPPSVERREWQRADGKSRAGEEDVGSSIAGEKGCLCPSRVQLLRARGRKSGRQSGCRSQTHLWAALEAGPAFETSEVHHVTERRPRRGARSEA